MPANTAGGFPYPPPTEPVKDGAIRIQGLATEVDYRLAKLGFAYGAIGGGVADANGALVVNYGRTFILVPAVTVTPFDSSVIIILYKPQLFVNSFTVLVKTDAGAPRPGAIEFAWTAVGPVR